jgi:hypothetical protein
MVKTMNKTTKSTCELFSPTLLGAQKGREEY